MEVIGSKSIRRMLNGDFDESLAIIEKCIPKERQNLFFSATMKDFIKESSIFPISDSVSKLLWKLVQEYLLLNTNMKKMRSTSGLLPNQVFESHFKPVGFRMV